MGRAYRHPMTSWLDCEVVAGMFSDERAVVVRLADGSERSFFVPASEVDGDKVRVTTRPEGDLVWATLPTPNRDTVAVSPAAIS